MSDPRNVEDRFKGVSIDSIIDRLDEEASPLEIAVENTIRDFNLGSIVRTANAFGIRTVHIVGRKQWNKRGAMKTDAYLHVQYHDGFAELASYAAGKGMHIIAIDNVVGSVPLQSVDKRIRSILLFGQEGPGLSDEALAMADSVVAIEQYGSTRSLNVAAAAAVVMYEWRHHSSG